MGDRANVKIKEKYNGEVFLYTHWDGYGLPETVKAAMIRGRDRWNDASYLCRIVFCEMVKNDPNALTGFGISTSVGDGEDRVLIVDCDKQTIDLPDGRQYTFEQYVELINPQW